MDEFAIVKTLSNAIFGSVALVRHRPTSAIYAMKMMSLAHIAAQQAVTGPVVLEDGDTELRVLRRISGNRVMVGVGCDAVKDCEEPASEVDRCSWSVNPMWEAWGSNSSCEVDHHNLLILHKDFVDEKSRTRCLVFDFCPYGELYDQLQETPHHTLGIENARIYFAQIVNAVRYIHAHNIAHRDLSLENVLLDLNHECRLGDFGLSCEYGTMCSGRVGKAFYMAPEVYSWQPGELYNGLQADIWSLGIVLFILVTGAPPFDTPSNVDARFRLVKSSGIYSLLATWRLDAKLPHDLCDLLTQLLRVDADDRVDIENVWSHQWLQGGTIIQPSSKSNDQYIDGHESGSYTESSFAAMVRDETQGYTEPQEELSTEHRESTKTRHRKRIKIMIEPGYAEPSVGSSRIAGFFGGPVFEGDFSPDIGPPPELRHENLDSESSPHGPLRLPIQPTTSPIVWPKVGVEAAFRTLFVPEVLAVPTREDECKPQTEGQRTEPTRRRPRRNSSPLCSSSSSPSS